MQTEGPRQAGRWCAGQEGPSDRCVRAFPEIQSKRQERKRRSTANPAYSGLLETEVRPRCHPGPRPGPRPPCRGGGEVRPRRRRGPGLAAASPHPVFRIR